MSNFTSEALPNSESIIDKAISRARKTLGHYLSKTDIDTFGAKKVASIGCGMFFEARGLKESFPNAQILGIEKDEELYGAVPNTRIIPDGVEMIFAELTEGSDVLGEGQYDFIIARNPDVHRRANWERVFNLCKTALKPGGIIMVTSLTGYESGCVLNLMEGFKILINEENRALEVMEKREDPDDSYVIIGRNNS